MINMRELKQFMKSKDLNMSNEEIQRIIREIDYQGNGKINYSEFLSATLNLSTFMTESKLKSIFYLFDTD